MLRSLSPSGAPIRIRDIYHGLWTECTHTDGMGIFSNEIKEYFGVPYCFLLSSGKAALFVTLKALMSLSPRREVIIPAYSSFCLASIIAKAGLAVKLCDMDREYLDFDLEHLAKLVDENTLAVIPVHLFGMVARVDEIICMAVSKGAYVIEDAAQAAGAGYLGDKVGTIGHVGIFSLGRGKCISTIEGGVIVTKDETIAQAIAQEFEMLSNVLSIKLALTGLALSVFLRPQLYAIPSNMPGLNIGANTYDPEFPVGRLSEMQAGIGISVFNLLDDYNRVRIENADYLRDRLNENHSNYVVKSHMNASPVYTRFAFICDSSEYRECIYNKLNKARLGVSKNFPYSLHKIEGFGALILNPDHPFIKAYDLSHRLLTLPTHPYVKKHDLDKMVACITVP